MIIGKKDREQFQYQADLANRLFQAHRWLSEFDDILGPMWDYVMGKLETIPMPSGEHIWVMPTGDVSTMRDALRERLAKALEKRAADVCAQLVGAKP